MYIFKERNHSALLLLVLHLAFGRLSQTPVTCLQLYHMYDNPYPWGPGASDVTSEVMGITFRGEDGEELTSTKPDHPVTFTLPASRVQSEYITITSNNQIWLKSSCEEIVGEVHSVLS